MVLGKRLYSICELLERKEIGKKVDYKYDIVTLWNLLGVHVGTLRVFFFCAKTSPNGFFCL